MCFKVAVQLGALAPGWRAAYVLSLRSIAADNCFQLEQNPQTALNVCSEPPRRTPFTAGKLMVSIKVLRLCSRHNRGELVVGDNLVPSLKSRTAASLVQQSGAF